MADDFSRRDDSVKEEVSAFGQRVKGAAKDATGSVTGNRSLEREGELENASGRARQAGNDVFDETDGVPGRTVDDNTSTDRGFASGTLTEEASATGQRAKGAAKDATGSLLGINRIEREGEIENASGRARQAANDVFDESDRTTSTGVHDTTTDRGFASGTLTEEVSATGQRAKGAAKDATGSLLGLNRMEHEGEIENAAGRARQSANDVDLDGPDTTSRNTSDTSHRTGHLVTGLYDSPEHAGRAYTDLTTKHGYGSEDVSVLMSDETRQRHFGDAKPGTEFKSGSKAAEGAGVGGATGISIGAVLGGLLAAATSIAIPGIGLVVAGPLAGAIAGAGAGGAAGTLIGALIGAGIPEERAKVYDEGIRGGGIVLGTRARDEAHAAELERDFTTHGGRDIRR